jgi:hypothetical protein
MKFRDYIFQIREVLDMDQYKLFGPEALWQEKTIPHGGELVLAASRVRFYWQRLAWFSQAVCVFKCDTLTPRIVETLKKRTKSFAQSQKHFPLFRGLQFGYMNIPVMLCSQCEKDAQEIVESLTEKSWTEITLPIIINLKTEKWFVSEKSPYQNDFFFAELKNLAEDYLMV